MNAKSEGLHILFCEVEIRMRTKAHNICLTHRLMITTIIIYSRNLEGHLLTALSKSITSGSQCKGKLIELLISHPGLQPASCPYCQ